MAHENASPAYVVLGATGATGREVARRLRNQNARLMLGARNEPTLFELADSLQAQARRVDAQDLDSIEACIAQAKEQFGQVNGVVNCMGNLILKPAHLTTMEEWADTLQINLTSSFAALRAATKAMTPGGGSIVLVSSAAARIGLANHEAIAAAKGGIEGMVRSAAASYGARGIRVNAVAPGLVQSSLTARITANEKALETSRKMHVLGRVGEPQDLASAIVWLLDGEQSPWVTGQVLGVDGGLGTVRTRG